MGIFSSSYWKMDRFPFFEDPNSIHYIKQSRLLVFIPGDDDLCKKFREVYPSAKIFQGPPPSDEDGEDESFVSKVKEWMEKVPNDSSEMAVINHEKLATVEELQPFSQLGVKYQFVELYPYKSDREPLIPLFYGWFFNLRDSGDTLRRRADDLLRKVSKQDRFNKEFSKFAMDWDSKNKFDIKKYFSTKTLFTGETLLHCTGYFTNFKPTEEATKYHRQHAESFGKAFDMKVIGYIITPRTFGVRLELNDEELKLWHEDDRDQLDVLRDQLDEEDRAQLDEEDRAQLDEEDRGQLAEEDRAQLAEGSRKGDLEWEPSKFSPTNGPGSRAHLTLAVREKVHPLQTGLDLKEIIKKEVEDQKTGKDRLTINLECGVARCYGNGSWAVYLNKSQEYQALFSSMYLKK
ncbi:2',3'-cyclic-nucleotide 3'-phosphodiesterase-like isoform X2 [Apostichopus japonicus]